jgi:hypothetical protein
MLRGTPFGKEEKCHTFSFNLVYILAIVNQKHLTIKRGNLDELIWDA